MPTQILKDDTGRKYNLTATYIILTELYNFYQGTKATSAVRRGSRAVWKGVTGHYQDDRGR